MPSPRCGTTDPATALRAGSATTQDGSASTSVTVARPAARPARPRSAMSTRHSLPSPVIAGCGGDGVVDEDGGDGGGGWEGGGVEDPGAGRGTVEAQRKLVAELFRVGGAGFAGGV